MRKVMVRNLLIGLFAFLLALPVSARVVTDSAGREVELPDRIDRVFAAGPPAAVLLYVLAPEKMVGWPRALRPDEREYVAEPYRDLPATGRLTGRGGEANLERLLAAEPDLILDFGSVSDTYVDLANRVQAQTDIPYVLINGRFSETASALRLLGEILGVPERGERLAADFEQTLATIDAITADIAPEDRPQVYLARGPVGLETGTRGSINTEIIERAGGVNVMEATGRGRIVRTSIEQVLRANPDTVVTWDSNFYARVWFAPIWSQVEAVQRGRVYLAPSAPFGWIDRPPSLNRVMGLKWMAAKFYPERWPNDLAAEVRDFYALYYQVELSDAQLEVLLDWADGRPPRR